MEGAKEYFLRLREEEYFDLPQHLREKAEVYYNDYALYKDDPLFKGLYKNYKDAKTELEKYKFDKRHP